MSKACAIAAALVLALLAAACSTSDSPTAPRAAYVRFDSVTTVFTGGRYWKAFVLTNSGGTMAFRVRVYWHFYGGDSGLLALTRPSDLLAGEAGYVPTVSTGYVGPHPAAPDSIRWSDAP